MMAGLHPAAVFLGGLVVIVLGAEVLLRGASRIALLLGIPPILVGLTIVSVGTSAPELAVGITAVAEGKGPLAVGNIAGTNILNILFILGLSAWMRPLPLQLQSIRLDVPVMIATALLLIFMAADRTLSRLDGWVLLALAAVYTTALVRTGRRESAAMQREFAEEFPKAQALPPHGSALPRRTATAYAWNTLLLVAGMALTVLGADLLVAGASAIAAAHGVSDAVIGLTIVAIGTSAPELATTVIATLKNDRDVAIGNLIGSSIYNILVILGLTCVVAPAPGVPLTGEILWIDLPLAALVALVCLPVFRSGRMVSRIEGAAFVAAYLIYLGTLVLVRA